MTKVKNQVRLKAVASGFEAIELNNPVTRTATSGGATTGLIAATDVVVAATGVTSQTGYLLTLPAPVVGKEILLLPSTYAYKVQTSGTSIKINSQGSAAGTLTVAATTGVRLLCVSATNWLAFLTSGTVA
jgi:hypothetical protein